MLRIVTTLLFLGAAVINLGPVLGVLSAGQLETAYGVKLDDPNLVILMRHRALLFGVVGGLLVVAAFHVRMRPTAVLAGLFSMLSFLLIAHLVGGVNEELRKVSAIDWIGIVLLVAGAIGDFWIRAQSKPRGDGAP
jgi:hypothetical protein